MNCTDLAQSLTPEATGARGMAAPSLSSASSEEQPGKERLVVLSTCSGPLWHLICPWYQQAGFSASVH